MPLGMYLKHLQGKSVIQEFLSATKQQLATKKGLASTVDINLRPTLLAHHAKLETKLGSKK